MAVNIRPYIVINGKSSMEVSGLLISTLPAITKPQKRVIAEEIDGRDGDIVTELGFSAYDKKISIGLYGEFDVDEIISFFNQSGIITFSNEPDKYYKFAQYSSIDFEKLIRFKKADVTFHVQPFKYSVSEGEKTFDMTNVDEISIRNTGNYFSKPTIKITGSGNVALSLNGSEIMLLDMTEEHIIILDATEMNAYNLAKRLMNRKITGDFDRLVFEIGRNVISYSGTVTEIAVSNYSRWL